MYSSMVSIKQIIAIITVVISSSIFVSGQATDSKQLWRPYAKYFDLSKHLDKLTLTEYQDYTKQYQAIPAAPLLRRQWLSYLAKHNQWQTYIAAYQDPALPQQTLDANAKYYCWYLQAKYKQGERKTVFKEVPKLWNVGFSQPASCDPIFKKWLQAINYQPAIIWERFVLAIENDNLRLARYLSHRFNQKESGTARKWLYAYHNASKLFHQSWPDTERNRKLILHIIKREAMKNPVKAERIWHKLVTKYQFSKLEQKQVINKILLFYAVKHNPNTQDKYSQYLQHIDEPAVKEWLVRYALKQGDWPAVKLAIDNMAASQREKAKWQYWYARALDKTGDKAQARQIWQQLADKRHYYGFLASHQHQQQMAMQQNKMDYIEFDVHNLKQLPAVQRAKLLYDKGEFALARLELKTLCKQLNIRKIYVLANIINHWGWHEQAIRLTELAEQYNDLTLRFPLAYQDILLPLTKKLKLEPALVYAMIKQESGFMHDAQSPRGALGLMQLLPRTANAIAKRNNYPGFKDNKQQQALQLLQPKTNLNLGTHYLKVLQKRLPAHPLYLIAAYNAGQKAVMRWQPTKAVAADVWIETIPWLETRNYLKNVISYYVVYQHCLGQKPKLQHMLRQLPQPTTGQNDLNPI